MFRLLLEISPEQVDEWIAFDELEPLGLEKLYAMLALHGSNLATIQGFSLRPGLFYPGTAADGDGEPMSNDEFTAAFARLGE